MNRDIIANTLSLQNPWWQQHKVPEALLPDFERPVFHTLVSYLEKLDRILVIKGPRRVGKTTLMYQLIHWLLTVRNARPQDILFISFDSPGLSQEAIADLFHVYATEVKRAVLSQGSTYIFLDEVHFHPQWALAVKQYFDRKLPLTFVASSSAASLFQHSRESLAGRTVEEVILPFSFREFCLYHVRHDARFTASIAEKRYLPYREELEVLFARYLKEGGFPHLLTVGEEALRTKLLREDVVEKVVYRDVVELYGVREPKKLENLFLYLLRTPGQLVNLSSLSKHLSLSREFSEKYLSYLIQAYLVFPVSRWSPSSGKRLRSAEKIYSADPALSTLLGAPVSEDFVVESIGAQELFRRFSRFGYWRNGSEVDFIVEKGKEIIPLEVKNTPHMDERDVTPLKRLHAAHPFSHAILLYRGARDERSVGPFTVALTPIIDWLLEENTQ